MPRRLRVLVEGGIYHVYNRLARGAEVLRDDVEAGRFVELLRSVRDRDGLNILAWCLMPGHYHLAVRVGPVPFHRSMGYLQARFGQGHNSRQQSSGPLWQSRYKAKLVEAPGHLNQLVTYIHLNPVVAGLVADPADHPWSGHRELVQRVKAPLSNVDAVLAGFGSSLRAARLGYGRALAAGRESGWVGELPGRLPWWGREPDLAPAPPASAAWVGEQGRSPGRQRGRMAAADFLRLACACLGMERERFSARGKGSEVSRARYLVAALAVERWGLGATAIGEVLGRQGDAISRWVGMGAALRRQDPVFAADYEDLDRTMSELSTDGGIGGRR